MTSTEETYWLCRGLKNKPHPEEEVEAGERCPICDRSYTDTQIKPPPSLPVGKIIGGVALLALLAGGGYLISQSFIPVSCEENPNQEKCPSPKPLKPPQPIVIDRSQVPDYPNNPERFTWGQRKLFTGIPTPDLDRGIEAFKQKDYQQAETFFQEAVTANRSEPEPLILLNNAKARQQGNPLTLAAVVPVGGNMDSAKEMLRGIAMAQDKFNSSDGKGGRLLEIVIANDGNDKDIAKQTAQQLAKDPSILGVIGHNSSSASKAGLEVYENKGLAMISPTSTSTSLQSNIFFRTAPSDAAAAEELAKYAQQQNLTKVVIFYNPDSLYSQSLQQNFESRFEGEVVESVNLDSMDFDPVKKVKESALIEEAQAAVLFPDTSTIGTARKIAIANRENLEPDKQLRLLGGDALYNPDTIINGGESVEGLVLAVPWSIQSLSSASFKQAGDRQWGGSVNWRTAMSYDATQAFINSFDTKDNSRSSILEALSEVKLDSNETSGIEVRFTSQGERQGKPVLVKVAEESSYKVPNTNFGFDLVNSEGVTDVNQGSVNPKITW